MKWYYREQKERAKSMGMKMTATAKKQPDQAVKPGELISATITKGGSRGCMITWNHAPEDPKGKESYPRYVEHRPDPFETIEEACHAIAQAFGGNSELSDYEEGDDKGEKAA